jgi:SAM-dependent methyltransferase
MAYGTLPNIANAGHEPTPDVRAEQLARNLVTLPRNHFTVLDATCGEGNLLAPFADCPHAELIGIEINGKWAALAAERLPQAQIITVAIEHVHIAPNSISLAVLNPPYLVTNGGRMELQVFRQICDAVQPHGVIACIVPARSAWDRRFISAWARRCYDVRAWKFPSTGDIEDKAGFERYSQIVVIGCKRPQQLAEADTREVPVMVQWRYVRAADGEYDWVGKEPPPDLPDQPIDHPYRVPPAAVRPTITVRKASEALIVQALAHSGCHRTPRWAAATTYTPGTLSTPPPLMPLIGKAHLAAEVLNGRLDGRIISGPRGQPVVLLTNMGKQANAASTAAAERERGVVAKTQEIDNPLLGVLDLATGATSYYQGDDVFTFLDDWLPILASQILALREPRYNLNNADDWMLQVAAQIGVDKQLPGATHPGLADAQIHRVNAMFLALAHKRRVAIQGQPGTGKTRLLIALMAQNAYYWQTLRREEAAASEEEAQALAAWPKLPEAEQTKGALRALRQQYRTPKTMLGKKQPAWVQPFKVAWRSNPRVGPHLPHALPQAITTPKRVTTTWEREIAGAWPEAEIVLVEDYIDIARWMERCKVSTAPSVIAIISQSLTAPGRITWTSAVQAVDQGLVEVPNLDAEGEPVADAQGRTIAVKDAQGQIITRLEHQYRFYCPDCGRKIHDIPRGEAVVTAQVDIDADVAEAQDEEARAPVGDIAYFLAKRRWCRECGAALWTKAYIDPVAAAFPSLPFAEWSTAVEAVERKGGMIFIPRGRGHARLARAADGPIVVPSRPCHTVSSWEHPSTDGRVNARRETFRQAQLARQQAVEYGRYALAPISPTSWSPFDYLKQFYAGCCAFLGVDESHNTRGDNSDIARAIARAKRASQSVCYASGTHYAGSLELFFRYWFRFAPDFWLRLGYTWKDINRAIEDYGFAMYTTREVPANDRSRSGLSDYRTSKTSAPGISSRLLPELLSEMVYIDILDVAAFMPPLFEYPEVVSLVDDELTTKVAHASDAYTTTTTALKEAQATQNAGAIAAAQAAVEQARAVLAQTRQWASERDLARAYHEMTTTLTERAKNGSSTCRMMGGMLPRWFVAYPFAPPFQIWTNRKGQWSEDLGRVLEYQAPTLSPDHRYPLERRCDEIVGAELAERRTVMVYYEQSMERDVGTRLMRSLAQHTPWLLPDTVDAEDREDAIVAAVKAGHRVVIVGYRRVSEGLNLQIIDTVVWFEMAQHLILLTQASQRAWRLGKQEEVRIYYLAYAGTVSHNKLKQLASQGGAAALFSGNAPKGGLAEHVGADQGALAQITQKLGTATDLSAAFSRRHQELESTIAAGRDWLGVEQDTLPERMARIRAAPPCPLWLPPRLPVVLTAKQHSSHRSAPATPDEVGQNAAVTFGNLDDIGKTLRGVRKARREEMDAQNAEDAAVQSLMFDL